MRKKQRFIAAASLVAVLGLVAAACGDDDDSAEPGTTAQGATTTAAAQCVDPPADPVTVGLLFDVTGRGDFSFNDSAAAGADKAKCDFGVKVTESTPSGDADRPERIKLISEQNQLVIPVGFLWEKDTATAAAAYPDVNYGIVDGTVEGDNVAMLKFAENEGSYLVGVAAAIMSKSGNIGFVGGVENDLIKKFEAGFVAGAESVKADIKVQIKYITQPPDFSGFNDATKGKEIAKAMYDGGADVVYHAAGGSGTGVFQAAKEAGSPGEVWAIGVDSDQYLSASDDLKPYILTSMLKRVDVAVYDTIKAEVEDAFKGGEQIFDLKVDGVGYATSGDFLSDEAIAAMEKAKSEIVAGTVTVPTAP
jgi:basic membrane protein A